MRAPEPIRRLYATLNGIPMETLTKAWWWQRCDGQPHQRSVAEMKEHRSHYGTGGNCFDLAYWLLELAKEAGLAALPIGHDLETEKAHAAILMRDESGREFLCDPGDLWLQPILVSPTSSSFSPDYHQGFFPAAAVKVERAGSDLLIRYRRPNGKESQQRYDLSPVPEEAFLRACHQSQRLLRKSLVEQLRPFPETGELAHWEYADGRSFWSTAGGLVQEPSCTSAEAWGERIKDRAGIAPEISLTALRLDGDLA